MGESLDPKIFRQAMGLFATGVTVLSTEVDGEVHAMTANAFSSVSLDPPLVLVCLNRGAKMERVLQEGSRFAVNFLGADQEALSRHFAGGFGNDRDPEFTFTPFAGAPRLVDALAAVVCEVRESFDGGDHVIVLGRVLDIQVCERDVDPLLFWKGKYHALDSTACRA